MASVEKRLSDVEASIKVIAEYVKQQNEKIEKEMSDAKAEKEPLFDTKEIEELKAKVDSVSKEKLPSLKKIDELEKRLNERIERFDKLAEAKAKKEPATLRTDLDNLRRDVTPKLQFLENKLSKLAEANESLYVEDLKERVNGIDKKLNESLAVKNQMDDVEKALAEMRAIANRLKNYDIETYRKEFDKRIEEATAQFKGVETEDFRSVTEQLEYAKDTLDDESVSRQSLEKRVHDIETKMDQMRNVMKSVENIEGLDVEKLSARLQDMESNMKMTTVRLLTQQLNEFAKSVDRRLPNIVSREEYARQVADLNQRMRTIEAPDLSPLGTRVERLEKKVDEIAAMMRAMYNRIPIVVE